MGHLFAHNEFELPFCTMGWNFENAAKLFQNITCLETFLFFVSDETFYQIMHSMWALFGIIVGMILPHKYLCWMLFFEMGPFLLNHHGTTCWLKTNKSELCFHWISTNFRRRIVLLIHNKKRQRINFCSMKTYPRPKWFLK